MKASVFADVLKQNNGIQITDELVVYRDLELYNYRTFESKQYPTVQALLDDNEEVARVVAETEMFEYGFNGGRGASSASMGGGFGNAGGEGNTKIESLFPAELNYGTKNGNSVEAVLGRFQDKYGNADREYGVLVDANGYVKEHNKGEKHSVGFLANASEQKGGTFIHNHPSGSNFSDTDLHTFANSNVKSVVATSSNSKTKGTYQISKTDKFKAKEFDKAIGKAKWDTSKYGYNDGADWWLKQNQKKYGYKYTSKGMKNAGKADGW